MIYPETDELSQYPRYILALLTARRAQMLRAGEKPLVEADSDNLLSIALEEIAQGKIRPRVLSPEEVAVEIVDRTKLSDVEIERPLGAKPDGEMAPEEYAFAVEEEFPQAELDVRDFVEDDIPEIPEEDDLNDDTVAKLSDLMAQKEALVSEELQREKEGQSMDLYALLRDMPEEETSEDAEEEDVSLSENG